MDPTTRPKFLIMNVQPIVVLQIAYTVVSY
jgi:hypothetical protein